MSGPFNVGDVVVCVDDSPCRCCGSPWPVALGSIHKVTGIQRGYNKPLRLWVDALHLAAWPDSPRHPAWRGTNAERFRHLPKADEQFTAQMRAIKPARKQVSA